MAADHRQVATLAVPIIIANLTQPMLAAADTAVAGHLGAASMLGGVAQGGLLLGFIFWSFGFLRMGTTGLVAQAAGAGDERAVAAHLARGLSLALALGTLLLLAAPLLLPNALALLGGSAAVQADAHAYCLARLLAAPAVLGNYVVLGHLLGLQRVRSALMLQVGVNIINLSALAIAVGKLGGGVASIGIATACADILGFAAGLLWLAHMARQRGAIRQSADGAPTPNRATTDRMQRWLAALSDRAAWRRLVGVNRDIFVRTFCLLAALAAFSRGSARLGDTILAANAVLQVFGNLTSFALDGIAQAVEALVGTAVGRRDRAAFAAALRASAHFTAAGATCFALFYLVCGDWLIAKLTALPEVAIAAHHALPWAVLLPLVAAPGFLLDGVYIGATRTGALMRSMVVAAIGFAATLYASASWGNNGLWCALIVLMLLRGVTLALWLPSLLREHFALRADAPT
ncbi:MATE family efflux transporter [Chitinasiproducens palmae]|uniref:Multidrug resistance protein, MATE family n=1 Tax=Chitinasiproducens palmae TaxID=1770053 RepID=A0A1H2PQX3_9BURK|nr:MATE family efflux transporter [Chitinasiproducens palmae]SDV49257.1 multidrug resistance protein, MATE family [Chitinasiproducens palmae]